MPDLDLTPRAMDPDVRLQQRVVALERRVRDLERASAMMPVNNGAPAGGEGRDGSMSVDQVGIKLWVKVFGAWRYTTLT